QIDETRIYNRALSANEVKSLYDLGASDKVNTSVSTPQGTGRLDSGLAGYWKLDENTGTSAGDASTGGHTGTLTGGPTWTTGRIGSAVNFEGVNDEIGVSDEPALDFGVGEAFSYAGWFNLSAVDGNEPLVMKSANDVSQGYGLFIHTTDLFNIMLNDATDDCSDYVDLNTTLTGAWHHYVWSVDTSHISRLYVDGTLRLTTDCSVSGDLSNADDLSLGWMYAGTSQYFSGKQDDVRLYNRVLSADEVGQLYRLTTPTGVDTSLKGYWSFDGSDTLNASSDPQFTDLSGVGYVGYIDSFASSETKLVPGKLGQAVDFENDGSVDNYIFAGPADSLDNATYVSACAWINPESTPGGWAAIMGKGWEFEVTSNNAIELWLPSGGTNGGAWDTPNGSIPFDTWSHVCFTRDFSLTANTPIIYINGSTVSTVFTDDSLYRPHR
ncbi:MAG: LamG domain-containing protein, partial [Candidatus Moraniibacteriota bacterium]